MSLETQVTELVSSANALTGAINGKVGEIDQRMTVAQADFDEWRQKKDVIGDPNGYGTMRMNILQGLVVQTRAGAPLSYGDLPAVDLGVESNVYIHFKTPLNVNKHNEMFWFNIRGYSFGTAKIIDETITGYCYVATRSLTSQSSFGNFTPESYVDSAGNVILRILAPNIYYSTVRVDTMRVGNGRLFALGDLDVRMSLAATVEF